MRTIGVVGASVAGLAAGALCAGRLRWYRTSRTLVERLSNHARSVDRAFSTDSIAGLPEPVARYFQRTIPHGQRHIRTAALEQTGQFFAEGAWRPFRATQHCAVDRPGFVWDARIRMAPGMPVFVRDAYVCGSPRMHAEMLAVYPLVDQHDTAELAAGALVRYLGEAVWMPTALLPSSRLTWEAIDADRARATLTDAGTTVSADFSFDAEGDVVELNVPDRMREVHGSYIPTPWRVQMIETADRQGMRLPVRSQVEWLLPGGPLPYWRGTISAIAYAY